LNKKYTGGLAVAVPGELKGYSTIYDLHGGGVSWSSLFEPTIQLCKEGMLISKILAISLKKNEELIKNDPMLRYNATLHYYLFIRFMTRKPVIKKSSEYNIYR